MSAPKPAELEEDSGREPAT